MSNRQDRDPLTDAAVTLFRLPFALAFWPLRLLTRAGAAVRPAATAPTPASTASLARAWAAPYTAPPAASPPATAAPPISATPSADTAVARSGLSTVSPAGGASSGAASRRRPTAKEERGMCDTDLSGDDLKVVQYSIVNVDPYLDDDRRILYGPAMLSTSEDMTPEDFASWVIARYFQLLGPAEYRKREVKHQEAVEKARDEEKDEPERDFASEVLTDEQHDHRTRLRHGDKKYLRVCFCVQCRLSFPSQDYEKDQVEALRRIDVTLRRKK